MADLLFQILPLIIIGAVVLYAAVRGVKPQERAVIFRLGKLEKVAGPGRVWLVPFIDKVLIFDLNEKLAGWQGMSEHERRRRVREQIEAELQRER